MRILVTGAGGFIGGVVADVLAAAGHQVTALIRTTASRPDLALGVEVVVADLTNPVELAAVGIDRGFEAVCHLAALTRIRESRRHPLRYFDVNVTGTTNLLHALERGTETTGVVPAVVFGSSCAVYGEPTQQPIPETRPPEPTSPYGASKAAAELVVAQQAATGRIGAVVLRSFNVAGAVDGHTDHDTSRLVPAALAAASGQADVFGLNGDGGIVREYVHVIDMAEAYLAALAAAKPGRCKVYNIGSGTGISVNDVLAAVERVSGRTVRRVRRPPVPEPPIMIADSRRVRAELGWTSPRSSIDLIVADAWAQTVREAEATAGSLNSWVG